MIRIGSEESGINSKQTLILSDLSSLKECCEKLIHYRLNQVLNAREWVDLMMKG